MINIWIVLLIIGIHWFADFVLQTDWQAKNKSKSCGALLAHTIVYSITWFLIVFGYIMWTVEFNLDTSNNINLLWFAPITFVCHTITDYFTSRLNTKLWNAGKVHNFFVSVGFDQVLHYIQLFLTYYFLKQL